MSDSHTPEALEALSEDELDELVYAAKEAEAEYINNTSKQCQITYLLDYAAEVRRRELEFEMNSPFVPVKRSVAFKQANEDKEAFDAWLQTIPMSVRLFGALHLRGMPRFKVNQTRFRPARLFVRDLAAMVWQTGADPFERRRELKQWPRLGEVSYVELRELLAAYDYPDFVAPWRLRES